MVRALRAVGVITERDHAIRGSLDRSSIVEQLSRPDDSEESRQASAEHLLHQYRERRRRRRGEDTYFGSADALLNGAEAGLGEPELERRRSDIMDDARELGMSEELAGLLYDVAREEGLDPSLGFELVRTGLGVAPPAEGVSNAPAATTADRYLPAWIFPAAPPDDLLRERMLRTSFRRLRGFLEKHHEIEKAFREFAAEPDVGHHGY